MVAPVVRRFRPVEVISCVAILSILVDGAVDVTGCPTEFLGRCTCRRDKYEDRIQFITNCTNTRFTDVSLLEQIPPETEVLIFTGNTLHDLPANVFGLEENNLTVVDLSDNRIRTIKGQTFHHVSDVYRLILNSNDIEITNGNEHKRLFSNFEVLRELHLTNAFNDRVNSTVALMSLERIFRGSELTHLRRLHLEDNEIDSVGNPNIFCELPNVEQILLSYNRIFSFPFNISCLKKLRFLDLEFNNIQTLDQTTLILFDQIPELTVDLKGNPFVCDSYLSDMLTWMKKTPVYLRQRTDYVCKEGRPSSNIGLALDDVKETEATSYMVIKTTSGSDTFWTVFLTLFVVSILLGSAYAYRRRKAILNKLAPEWRNLVSKLYYTSLVEPEPTPEAL
ncbi:unnamed protein product [Notodromas monacha]|uniref:Trophoblast glycoprotein n=1 Tax=Notodromas monacha TaxID=399045 RepID=A0A7R9BKS4_9CRUS|nr:unnamed protein product [Notodromas monacha]CAG0917303.1 unnamed protein product [Notodromas monacha]